MLVTRAVQLSLLLLVAIACNGCVVLMPDRAERIEPESSHLVESIQVEGLTMTVRRIDAVAISNSISSASGYGTSSFSGYTPYGSYSGHATSHASATASSTTTTAVIGTHESHALLGLAKHHLENQRAGRLVNTSAPADIVLRGQVGASESTGALWSAPLNVILFFGLVLPQTWGETYSVSIRAYAPDGEFLRQYDASAGARTLHHWAWWSRLNASEERKAAALAVATMRALNKVVADLRSGDLQRQ